MDIGTQGNLKAAAGLDLRDHRSLAGKSVIRLAVPNSIEEGVRNLPQPTLTLFAEMWIFLSAIQ
jgi:hypothetical protein